MLPVIGNPMAWLAYFVIGIAVSMALTIGLKMVAQNKEKKLSAAKA
jgi:uncharacterized membrane protein YuzA (DUF378 family)